MNQTKLNGLLKKVFSDSTDRPKTIRDTTIEQLYHTVDEYCTWYVEQGIYLPHDYARDPSGWSEVLNQIRRAFGLLFEDLHGEGEYWEAKGRGGEGEVDTERVQKLEKEIQEGCALFGKYLFYLTDEIIDRGPAHG